MFCRRRVRIGVRGARARQRAGSDTADGLEQLEQVRLQREREARQGDGRRAREHRQASYSIMRDALLKAGRPIVFSICEWGTSKPWTWARDVGNLWRTTGDIQDCWDCKRDWGGMGFVHILDLQDGLESYAGPGHWNDPDMLEVGNGGMTVTEYRSHFSLWCLLSAPLMAGNDLRSMSKEIKDILTNREVIAVDQDRAGLQGRRVKREGDREVWAKQLADGGRAVVLFNRGAKAAELSVSWPEIGY